MKNDENFNFHFENDESSITESETENPNESDWENYKNKYGKIYVNPGENEKRRDYYLAAKANAFQQIEKYFKEDSDFVLGENQYSDWSEDEIKSIEGFCSFDRQKSVCTEWEFYKVKFGKIYVDPKEDAQRFEIFQNTLLSIILHNKRYSEKKEKYMATINQWCDWTREEIRTKLHEVSPIPNPFAEDAKPFSAPFTKQIRSTHVLDTDRDFATATADNTARPSASAPNISKNVIGSTIRPETVNIKPLSKKSTSMQIEDKIPYKSNRDNKNRVEDTFGKDVEWKDFKKRYNIKKSKTGIRKINVGSAKSDKGGRDKRQGGGYDEDPKTKDEEWRDYKRMYGKKYANKNEDAIRRRNYEESKKMVVEHNNLFKDGKVNFEVGINEFSDWNKKDRIDFLHFDPKKRPDILDFIDYCACRQK